MVSLTVLKAVKVTPGLLVRFALLPTRKVKNPCIYCPGICIASCPTYVSTGNMALSPIGYSRDRELAVKACLKCWRCTLECPVHFPLPETLNETPVKPVLEIRRTGKPLLVAARGLDEELGLRLATRLNLGLAVVSGIEDRYTLGRPLDKKALRRIVKQLASADPVALSPETSHALEIPFILERTDLLPHIKYAGKVHIPCLLTQKKEKIKESLEKLGVKITEIDDESCIKSSCSRDVLYLCPRALSKGATTIFDLL